MFFLKRAGEFAGSGELGGWPRLAGWLARSVTHTPRTELNDRLYCTATAHVSGSITRAELQGQQLLPTVPESLPASEPAMSVSPPTYPYTHNVQRPKVTIGRHTLLLQTSSILNVRVGRDLRNSSSVFYNLSSRRKKKSCGIFLFKNRVLWKPDA